MSPGYWATHKYTRRAIIDLKTQSFCGWNRIQQLTTAADQDGRYRSADQPHLAARDRALVVATFKLGTRIGETVQLRRSMIRLDDGWVYCEGVPLLKRWRYRGAATRGGETQRLHASRDFVFPKSEPLTRELVEWLGKTDDYLFPSSATGRQHLSTIRAYQVIIDLAARTGFDCWPHRLRSERASQLAAEYKWRELELMRFFGWETEKQARLYAHESMEDMKKRFPHRS